MTDPFAPTNRRTYVTGRRYGYSAIDEYARTPDGTEHMLRSISTGRRALTHNAAESIAGALANAYEDGIAYGRAVRKG